MLFIPPSLRHSIRSMYITGSQRMKSFTQSDGVTRMMTMAMGMAMLMLGPSPTVADECIVLGVVAETCCVILAPFFP